MTAKIKINERAIGAGCPTYIIAEIGTNHNGDLSLALKTVQAAAESGVDAVKFQIITADRSYAKSSESYPLFKGIEIEKEGWKRIFAYAKECRLDCFATFANQEDIEDFSEFRLPAYKISSTNVTNEPLLNCVAKQGRPIILSTGSSTMAEVQAAVSYLETRGVSDLALLQCTSLYPTPVSRVHLNVIRDFAKRFPRCPVGFSDHTEGIHCAAASVALGGSIIEKHFTVDKNLKGPDHFFSADPFEMRALVKAVREVEAALGSPDKKPVFEEWPLREKWHRSIVALRPMTAGEILNEKNVGVKRAVKKGLSPRELGKLLGRRVKREIPMDTVLLLEDLER